MAYRSILRSPLCAGFIGLLLAVVLAAAVPSVAVALDTQDSQLFITGFNAYQKKDFATAVDKMGTVLNKYPDSPLRDMALFWMARANFKMGNQREAARYMAQFFKEYPDSPLKGTVEDELVTLAKRYENGDALPETTARTSAPPPAVMTPAPAAGAAAETAAAEKAEAERQARLRAEEQRQAAEKAAAEQAARQKAEAERLAAEKAAAEKAEAERLAGLRAEEQRQAAEKAAAEQAARQKAEAERLAAEKAAAEKAEAERLARLRAEEQRQAAEKAAAEQAARQKAEAERLAAEKAATEKSAAERSARSTALREKAVADYKTVVDRFPGTPAAATAAAKLRELGISYPPPTAVAAAGGEETAKVLSLEVGQFSGIEFTVAPATQSQEVGKRAAIPFEVANRGNGPDSYYLESGFPADFNVQFAAAAAAASPLTATPRLAPGEKFSGLLQLTIPSGAIDGERIAYPVKVVSAFSGEVSQSREVKLVAAAPLLRAVIKGEKAQLLPGEKVAYRVALLNIGSATARDITFRLVYPPPYEPLDAAGFKQEKKGVLVTDGLQLASGESREFALSFQLKDDALANQELFVRAETLIAPLQKRETFISPAATVQAVSGVRLAMATDRLVVIPGQTVTVPLVVTNTGNIRDDFAIRPEIPGTLGFAFYRDLNRDGLRQPDEPIINHVGPLAPHEAAAVLLEIRSPRTEANGATVPLALSLVSENTPDKKADASLRLVYSRPVLDLAMAGKGGKLKPGEVASVELTCTNQGSSMARIVELRSVLPSQVELVAADPTASEVRGGDFTWRFEELGAGEKRSIKVTFRVKSGTAVGTSVQLKNVVSYEDLLGNRY